MTLPLTHPVLIFALAMLVFVCAPLLIERLRVPGLIGVILAGALIGPNGLHLLARDATIVLLGTVGLLYLMFIAGAEIDLHGFRRFRTRSLVFGALTNLLPQTIGTALALALGYGWAASILLASMFASHTLVSYPIASRLGIARNEAVTVTVGGTIITDTVALLVLAIVAASVGGTLGAEFWTRLGISLVLFAAVVLLVLPRLARWFFRNERTGATTEFTFVLAAIFVCAYLAEVAGVEPILGAFLAGLALNRLIPENGPLSNRLHFFGDSFFVPFFLFSVGMLVDVRIFASGGEAWRVMLAMSGCVIATKWLAARLTQGIFGYSAAEGWAIFGLSVPQAAATLAATLVGYRIGLFDDAVLNGAIMMILVTCILGPWIVERYGRQVALQEGQKPYEPAHAPQRILIPLANPATAQALMDVAFLIRDPGSAEPLFPLTVVPEEEDEASAARIAEAEKMLGHAVIYAAGAEIPVIPLTRVDRNFAFGIARGITETRTSTVVVGWDGRKSTRHLIFGTVLDQLLERTRQLVLVCKLAHPLNTTKRLVVLVPSGSDHMPGYPDAVRVIKVMANRLGAAILLITVDADPTGYEAQLRRTRPDAPIAAQGESGWSGAFATLRRTLRPDDLVVVLSARRGSVAWHPRLERLPGQLARLLPESFLTLYPSELRAAAGAAPLERLLPVALSPERVVLDLPRGVSLEEALTTLLRVAFPDEPDRIREIAASLMQSESEFPTELLPGVMMPHARLAEVDDPILVVGVSREGVALGTGDAPVRLILLLLSPLEEPEIHLRLLAELARLLRDPERVDALINQRAPDRDMEWFATGLPE